MAETANKSSTPPPDEIRGQRTERGVEGTADLPLVLSGRFVENVFLAVDRQNSIFHHALPVFPASSAGNSRE
jgi:hypothetical protein